MRSSGRSSSRRSVWSSTSNRPWSSPAGYRLKTLGSLPREQLAKIDLAKLARKKGEAGEGPPLYNRDFVRRLHEVLARGLATVRLAADSLDTDPEGLKDLFYEYGMKVPFDL